MDFVLEISAFSNSYIITLTQNFLTLLAETLTHWLLKHLSQVREVLKLNIRTLASPRPRVTRTNFSIGAIDG